MPCPYARSLSNHVMNTNDDQYNEDSDKHDNNQQMTRSLSVNDVYDHAEKTKEPLNYTTYLGLVQLLSSLRCISHVDPSDSRSPPVHDEHFFIIIHQVFELWFKAFLYEIDSIRNIFSNSSNVIPLLFYINLRLNRSVGIWNMLIDMLQHLDTMTPVEFLAFRDFVTPASGFQSLQFRIIEMKLGLTDGFRKSYKTDYFINTMFKGEQRNELKKLLKEDSLLKLVERWLEYVYDSTTSFEFLDVFKSSVESFIEHGKKQKIVNGVDIETVKTETENMRRQFSSMIDPTEYKKLLDTQERRLSQKAMLAALMISLYHQQPCFQQAYQMLGLLMDVDGLIASWRHKHVLLVQRQIGRKPGTGGTGGFSYLHQTVNEKYQIFIDLFNISSYLIPQRFLPKFFGQLAEPANLLSTLHVIPPQQVPIIRSNPRTVSTRRLSQFFAQPDQGVFNLLLFIAGCLFVMILYGLIKLF